MLFLVIFLSLAPPLARGAHLEITSLNNSAIVALKVGNTFITKGNDWLVHSIELDTFDEILKDYDIMINQITTNYKTKHFKEILRMKFIQTMSCLRKLLPIRKTKRAINLLGTVIKTITGNLDNNDLVELNQQINELQYTNKDLVINSNQQIEINNQFQERITNITKLIYNERYNIKKLADQLKQESNQVTWEHLQHFQRLIFNLDVIQHQLDDISDSVILAKAGILSKSILQTSEIDHIVNKLDKFGIKINSEEQIYEFLEPAAFYNGSKIVFLVKIPKFLQGIFQQIIVESIPWKGEIIPIDFQYAILGANETFVTNETCTKIENNTICRLHNLKNISNDNCMHQLLRGNPSNCPFERSSGIQDIKELGDGKILVRSDSTVEVRNSCGYGPKNLTGSFLITIQNCSVQINNSTFESTQLDYNQLLDLLPLQSTIINKSKTIVSRTQVLQELHIINRKRINALEKNHQHTSYGGIFTAIAFLIIAIYLLREIRIIWTKIVIKPMASNTKLNRDGSI